jgi:hypothetical protein
VLLAAENATAPWGDPDVKIQEWTDLFQQGRRRCVCVGDPDSGALVGLDLEGRVFVFHDGEVIHRTNPDAVLSESHADEYLNPGGDGFWPAPEGSVFGYEYVTGQWRVPPGLSGARFRVLLQEPNRVVVRAEIDLINDKGIGLPLAFQREVAVHCQPRAITLTLVDSIEYLGAAPLDADAVRLAPWTLSQFDTSPGMEVVFPKAPPASIRDFYEPSDERRRLDGDLWHVAIGPGKRFQLGLGPDVDWIELRVPERNLRVRRTNQPIDGGDRYIDIADRAPDQPPSTFAARYSIYNDAGDFMEIEAAGPGAERLASGTVVSHRIVTDFAFGNR